jgi:hypothetical protein
MKTCATIVSTITFFLAAADPSAAQTLRAKVVTDADTEMHGAVTIQEERWVSGTGSLQVREPGTAVVFLADGSESVAVVPLARIRSLDVVYSQVQGEFTIVRRATLTLVDGAIVQGVLPGGQDLPGQPVSAAIRLETSPLVFSVVDMPDFASSSIPLPPPDKRLRRLEIIR